METITAKELLECLKDDKKDIINYKGMNFGDIYFTNYEKLSLIVIRYVFFFENDKFSFEKLTNQKNNRKWLNRLLKSFYRVLLEEKEIQAYEYLNKLFSLHYNDIIQNYNEFIKALKLIKLKIKYDLGACLICLLSYLNGNNKYLNVLSDISNKKDIISFREIYDKKREKNLWYVLTDYSIIYKMPILFKYNDNNISSRRFCLDLDELKCFVDICPVNYSFQKFIQTLYECIQDCKDLRINRPMKLKNFIQDIFLMLNICLVNCESWEDSILSAAYNEIYKISFNYTSENFNENYVDLVIHYITKYNLSKEDFFHLLLNGMKEGNFNKTFKNLHLKEEIKCINDEKIIQTLIYKMINIKGKRKNIKDKNRNKIQIEHSFEANINEKKQNAPLIESKFSKGSINKKDNNGERENIPQKEKEEEAENIFQNEKKKEVENLSQKGKETEIENVPQKETANEKKILIKESNNNLELFIKIDNKFQKMENEMSVLKKENFNMKSQISVMEKKIGSLDEDKLNMNDEISVLKDEISVLKDQNSVLKDQNSFLLSENSKKDIKIKDLSEDINDINKSLEKISFRDLTRKILDNMIAFVTIKDKTIFNGYFRRKDKLEVLSQKYKFEGIEYMKEPIKIIIENYYSSNSKSHVPQIVKIIRGKPFGLVGDPAGEIAKRYFKIMINSTDNNVIDFITKKLSIKKEINEIYLNYQH